jgi:hypothetical protein
MGSSDRSRPNAAVSGDSRGTTGSGSSRGPPWSVAGSTRPAASILSMPSTLADLEARIAALEAERADYRAVLAAINALGENQR